MLLHAFCHPASSGSLDIPEKRGERKLKGKRERFYLHSRKIQTPTYQKPKRNQNTAFVPEYLPWTIFLDSTLTLFLKLPAPTFLLSSWHALELLCSFASRGLLLFLILLHELNSSMHLDTLLRKVKTLTLICFVGCSGVSLWSLESSMYSKQLR